MGKRDEMSLDEVIIENSPVEKSLLVMSEVLPQTKDCSTCYYGKKGSRFRVGFDVWILCSNTFCAADSRVSRANGSFWVKNGKHSCRQ